MLMNGNEYFNIIESIKTEIKAAQYKAALSVNRELIMLYFNIGRIINEHKAWGNKFIDNLAADIKLEFPNAKGYSVRNLKYMAKFAETYPDEEFVQQVAAQIPWGQNIVLLDKVTDDSIRRWYIEKTLEIISLNRFPTLRVQLFLRGLAGVVRSSRCEAPSLHFEIP